MDLNTPVSKLFMVGPIYAKRLKKLGIETTSDLLYHFPHRYEDYSLISSIARAQAGEKVTIQGQIETIKNIYTRSQKKIQKAIIADQTGKMEITWFNQPFLTRTLKTGTQISLSGQINRFNNQKTMTSPEFEIIKKIQNSKTSNFKTIHTGRLVPVYPETRGVSSKWLRSRIAPLIESIRNNIEDYLPPNMIIKHELSSLGNAIEEIHFPNSKIKADKARYRFSFEELFLLHLKTEQRKRAWKKKKLSHPFRVNQNKVLRFLDSLPFTLTKAQKKACREILADLAKNKPMNRLLEGDVGSGKTVVAAIAIFISNLNECQSALMAPTEILANQHFKSLTTLLKPFGLKISLLTGSVRKKQAEFDLIIGTHALVHKRAEFKKLGLVVVDEQHRFGVEQRGTLIKKAGKGKAPHFLTMTATPIPRTVVLTAYGDLDLSVIDELPPGRVKIKTWVVPNQKRTAAYKWIEKQINKGDQAFIICPLIEESAAETLTSVKAAKTEFDYLQKRIFPNLRLGLLHGRMKSSQKDQVLEKFRRQEIHILVSTPVVEVGIDIPNATIMLIEAAERFGLAQLHQLRGRVGRGNKQSYTLLFTEKKGSKTRRRLKAMEKSLSGAELAEFDLKMRGPGELYGTKQHGFWDLKVASFSDLKLVSLTKIAAQKHIKTLNQYPLLKRRLEKDKMRTIEPN